MQTRFDVIVVGAGPAGLSFACLAADMGLQVAVIEQLSQEALAAPPLDGRDIALTHRSAQILKRIGLWQHIAGNEIAPIERAWVQNGPSPYRLTFDHAPAGQLGHLVSNQLIRQALYKILRTKSTIHLVTATTVTAIALGTAQGDVFLSDDRRFEASLIVAADSRMSDMRRKAGIGARMRDFGRTCIVCRMSHEHPHDGTAYEWFDGEQTLAVLPLNGRQSSIVLTLPAQAAPAVMTAPAQHLAADVEHRFAGKWGRMKLIGERYAYPLVAVYADRFYGRRLALIGDAAVGMHPVSAHGFNFGLSGAEALALAIRKARSKRLDIGSDNVLKTYHRQHRRATYPLYIATNALVELYTKRSPIARITQKGLLHLGNALVPIKHLMLRKLTAP